MDRFVTHTGVVAPLKRSSVDTDQIIPSEYMKRVTKSGFEDALFAAWRQDPDFLLNQPAFLASSILVTGPHFGTGSSREHAVWALRDFGFKVVLSSNFADIFRGNAGKQGLLAAVISEDDVERIWALIDARPGIRMTVDLDAQTAAIGDLVIGFDIDGDVRERLSNGLDDILLTLRHEGAIAQFEARREAWRPRTLPIQDVGVPVGTE